MKAHGRVAWLARGLVALAVGCAVSAALISTASCGAVVPTSAARKGGQLVALPVPKPQAFTTPDGRRGWKLKIPGGRPLATPAVAGGVLYVGGGFGSHEFYALDARTGARVWSFRTGDDGPTAAVVDEGCVTYNTESCTLFVHDARTGKLLWHRWLGDPLMSQPAIGDGRLFMAYPGKDRSHHLVCFELRTGKVLWDQKIAAEVITAPVLDGGSVHVATADGTLYRFDATTGKLLWSTKCNVTSAPRIVGGKVYISQRAVKTIEIVSGKGKDAKKTKSESTVEGFNVADAGTGKLAFAEPQATVRAAYLLDPRRAYAGEIGNVANAYSGQVAYRSMIPLNDWAATYAKHRQIAVSVKRLEELRKRAASKDPTAAAKDADEALKLASDLAQAVEEAAKDAPKDRRATGKAIIALTDGIKETARKTKEAAETARTIREARKAIDKEATTAAKEDASVGFAVAPVAANLEPAVGNIGTGHVKALWAFQGSRPHIIGSQAISVAGERFRAVDTATGKVAWERKVESKVAATRPATPPALAGGKFYLGTADGRILCVDPKTGKTLWESQVGGRILFQPAVADGRVYVATDDGTLICLQTGDPAATGWPMWGGSPRHNGAQSK